MDTLARFAEKFGVKLDQKPPIKVTNVTRTEMAKFIHEMNFKVGASSDPGALGFSYRISVQGCN